MAQQLGVSVDPALADPAPATIPRSQPLPTRRSLRAGAAGSVALPAASRAEGHHLPEVELPEVRRSRGTAAPVAARGRRLLAVKVGALAGIVVVGAVIVVQSHQGTLDAQTSLIRQPVQSPSVFAQGGPSSGASSSDSPTASPSGTDLATSPSPGPSGSVSGAAGSPSALPGASGAAGASPSAVRSGASKVSASAGSAAGGKASSSGSGSKTSTAAGVAPGKARTNQPGGTMAVKMYGEPQSGLAWHSGFWMGGTKNAAVFNAAGDWRGRPMDFATCYPAYSSWSDITDQSTCIGLMSGFKGRLALGLPMLPSDRRGQWDDVISGAHDDVFRTVAKQLKQFGFGDSAIRVGLEANGDWNPWVATADNAGQYKAAFRRIVGVMRAESPQLSFWFDISASANPLPGTSTRTGVFDVMYPGDDVVDGIAMDHYDFYSLVAHSDADFLQAMSPTRGYGLQDGVNFARAHGKGFAVPEWGVHTTQGAGDNPFFIKKMFEFFTANKDVLVFEDYFNEGDPYIGAAIWNPAENPQSGAMYKQLWGG